MKDKNFISNLISVLLILLPATLFGAFGNAKLMGLAIIAGFLSAVVLNLDKFESFSAWQIQAQLRKAEKVINEATATIDQLKEMSEPLIKNALINIINWDTMFGSRAREKEELLNHLLNNASRFKISSDRTTELFTKAIEEVGKRYFVEIVFATEKINGWYLSKGYNTLVEMDKQDLPSPVKVEDYLNMHLGDQITEDVYAALEEYKAYYKRKATV